MSSFHASAVTTTLLLVLVSTISFSNASNDYNYTIVVDPLNGVNNASCLPPVEPQLPCRNLSYAFSFQRNSTKYVLKSGPVIELHSGIALFEGVSQIAIIAENDIASVSCSEGAGLSFVNCSSLVFSNVTFCGCGALQNSTSYSGPSGEEAMETFLVALYFYQCQNISMNYVTVAHSDGASGVAMYDVVGTNAITNSHFYNNSVPEHNNQSGGGGFYMEFSYCVPGATNCSENYHQVAFISNSTYVFHNCTFEENRADTANQSSSGFILPYRQNHQSFGRGGGLSIYFKGSATGHDITISNCQFHHNHALWGGGLLVEFDDNSSGNNVIIEFSLFLENHCFFDKEFGSGGGVRVASMEQHQFSSVHERNYVLLVKCHFINNAAMFGGALSIQALLQPTLTRDRVSTVEIHACIFDSNFGHLGAAVNVATLPLVTHGETIVVEFKNCMFQSNKALDFLSTHNYRSTGKGTVYINAVPVSFKDSINFTCNKMSAIAAVGTKLDFRNCQAMFLRNSGLSGGAMALLGNAFIVVNDNTTMKFHSNIANISGGAIYNNYIGMEDLRTYVNCFIKYHDPNINPEEWKSKFIFEDNRALTTTNYNVSLGSSIYSTSILPCSYSAGEGITNNVSKIFCWNNWHYNGSKCSDEIYTEPNRFKTSEKPIDAYPGVTFNLSVNATDDLNHLVNSRTIYI